jgi:hypothetical protein
VRGLRYPSSPENAAQVALDVPDAVDRLAVIRYGQDHWDAHRIDAEITQVAQWAAQRGLPVVCNEFGVYRAFAVPADRLAWIHDVRIALERHGMGWTMWDYSGSFGVVTAALGCPPAQDRYCRRSRPKTVAGTKHLQNLPAEAGTLPAIGGRSRSRIPVPLSKKGWA